MTFTLTGFSVVRREGIELAGSGTVQVNADLKVGALEETITVTGETPIVDVQNAARQQILSGELVANTPAARSWNGIMLLMPGVTGDPNTVQLTPGMVTFGIHGGPTSEGRLQVDGMNVGASRGGGGVSGYSVDTANVQEITFRTSGGLGEAETGGPLMNIVPKTGGNTFRGSSSFQFSNSSLQGDNFSDTQRTQLSKPSSLLRLWDVDYALGGPIKKDKLWFFYLGRSYGNSTVGHRDVRQSERRQPECVDLRSGSVDPGEERRRDAGQRPAPDVADQPDATSSTCSGTSSGAAAAQPGSARPPSRAAPRRMPAGLWAAPRRRRRRPAPTARTRTASGRRPGPTR